MSSESDLEMHSSGRNEALIMVGTAVFPKSPSFELGEISKSVRRKWTICIDARGTSKQSVFVNTSIPK